MKKKNKETKIKEITYSCLYSKLSGLIDYFKSEGATEEDFKDIEFGLDYSNVWYEGDNVGIEAVWYKKEE